MSSNCSESGGASGPPDDASCTSNATTTDADLVNDPRRKQAYEEDTPRATSNSKPFEYGTTKEASNEKEGGVKNWVLLDDQVASHNQMNVEGGTNDVLSSLNTNTAKQSKSSSSDYDKVQSAKNHTLERQSNTMPGDSFQDCIEQRITEENSPQAASAFGGTIDSNTIRDSGPPLPPHVQFGDFDHSRIEAKKRAFATNVELLPDNSPPLYHQDQEVDSNAKKEALTKTTGLVQEDQDFAPVPPQMRTSDCKQSFELKNYRKKGDTQRKGNKPLSNRDELPNTQAGQLVESPPSSPALLSIAARSEIGAGSNQSESRGNESAQPNREPSGFLVPEAYPVNEEAQQQEPGEEVLISGVAELMPPWWKTVTSHICSFICFVSAFSMVVILPMLMTLSYCACYLTDSWPSQTLDFSFFNSSKVRSSADRNSLVVAVEDSELDSTFVIFYSLQDSNCDDEDLFSSKEYNIWDRVDFVERDEPFLNFDVSISGNITLLAAATSAGCTLYSYKRELNGTWIQTSADSIPTFSFNSTELYWPLYVDMDDDLAGVSDSDNVYIYKQVNGHWMHMDMIDLNIVEGFSVVKNTIAVQGRGTETTDDQPQITKIRLYKYDHTLDKVAPLQEPLGHEVSALAMSEHHLAYSSCPLPKCEVFLYNRNNSNASFALLEKLEIDAKYGIDNLSIDQNILQVRYQVKSWSEEFLFHVRLVTFENEKWEKSNIYASRSSFEHHHSQITSGNLITTSVGSVESVEVGNCAPSCEEEICAHRPGDTAGYSIGIAIFAVILIGTTYCFFRRCIREYRS